MGDIIWGTFITFTILLTLAVYRFRTRNKPHERNLARFVSILVLMGGLLGILTTGLNERLLRDHSLTYFLSLTFFILQTLASLLYYKRFKAIMALLILTLIMQM